MLSDSIQIYNDSTILGSCPYGIAWTGKASGIDTAHSLTTCSNAGLCNNTNGICECFQGFSGDACQFGKIFDLIV